MQIGQGDMGQVPRPKIMAPSLELCRFRLLGPWAAATLAKVRQRDRSLRLTKAGKFLLYRWKYWVEGEESFHLFY